MRTDFSCFLPFNCERSRTFFLGTKNFINLYWRKVTPISRPVKHSRTRIVLTNKYSTVQLWCNQTFSEWRSTSTNCKRLRPEQISWIFLTVRSSTADQEQPSVGALIVKKSSSRNLLSRGQHNLQSTSLDPKYILSKVTTKQVTTDNWDGTRCSERAQTNELHAPTD